MVKLKIDDEWFDASYNECIQWLIDNNCMERLRQSNWVPQCEFYPLKDSRIGLAELYPTRVLSPILHRLDCDDILCATINEGKQNECPVAMIHDFANEGWEGSDLWNSISDWYEDTKSLQW